LSLRDGGTSLSSLDESSRGERLSQMRRRRGVGVTLAEVLMDGYDEGAIYYVDGLGILCCGAREANPSAACRGSSGQACVIFEEKDKDKFRLREDCALAFACPCLAVTCVDEQTRERALRRPRRALGVSHRSIPSSG
jgi:hypothetical protein